MSEEHSTEFEYGFDEFARKMYYAYLEEAEAWGEELVTFNKYLIDNQKWLEKNYYKSSTPPTT